MRRNLEAETRQECRQEQGSEETRQAAAERVEKRVLSQKLQEIRIALSKARDEAA